MLNSKLVAVYAVSAVLLGGCVIKDVSDDEHSSDGACDDYGLGGDGSGASGVGASGVGASTSSGGGGEGGDGGQALCADHADCGVGAYCDDAGTCADSAQCEDDTTCADGFICEAGLATCIPGQRTCEELEGEQACIDRADCEPVYAGVDCSCGADCTCIGGQAGCVCESFEFFVCEPVS